MALNIPLPMAPDQALGQGISQGINLFQVLQNAKRMREQMGLAQQQENRLQQLQPLELQNKQAQMEIAKLQEQRLRELFPFQKDLMQAQARHMGVQSDKLYRDMYPHKALMDTLTGLQGLQGSGGASGSGSPYVVPMGQQSYLPESLSNILASDGEQQQPSDMFSGMGMFAPPNHDVSFTSDLEPLRIPDSGKFVVVPRTDKNGKELSIDEAIDKYHNTGEHLGVFNSREGADQFVDRFKQEPKKGDLPFGISLEDIGKRLVYKSLGLSGKTPDQIDRELDMRERNLKISQDKLDEAEKHNERWYKTQTPEFKREVEQAKAEVQNELDKIKKAREVETSYAKDLNKEDAKLYGDMQSQYNQGIQGSPVFSELSSLLANPKLSKVLVAPEFGQLSLDAIKRRTSDKEVRELIGTFENVVTKAAVEEAKSMGGHRMTDKDLVTAQLMKVGAGDSVESARAKGEMMIYLHDMTQKRLNIALDLIRNSERPLTPSKAMQMADKIIDGDSIRKEIKNKIQGKPQDTAPKDAQSFFNQFPIVE